MWHKKPKKRNPSPDPEILAMPLSAYARRLPNLTTLV
jgi:hypothetical protein